MEKYDAILCVEPSINETVDDRVYARRGPGVSKGFTAYSNTDDPKLYDQFSFGQSLKSQLSNLGSGYYVEVTDFKKWVVVRASHHNHITGKTSSKTFLVVFKHKGDGIVLNTHNRYRTISGLDQAVSYIRSSMNSLTNDTQNRLS